MGFCRALLESSLLQFRFADLARGSSTTEHEGALQGGLLRSHPIEHVLSLPSDWPSPAQVLEGLLFRSRPPVFFGYHEGPAVAAAARQRQYFDCQTVPWAGETVPLSLELYAIMRPVRPLQGGI